MTYFQPSMEINVHSIGPCEKQKKNKKQAKSKYRPTWIGLFSEGVKTSPRPVHTLISCTNSNCPEIEGHALIESLLANYLHGK